MRLLPRSLTGQIMALIAVALFLAQTINFVMLLNERRSLRFAQATGPAAARMVDAAEGLRGGDAAEQRRKPGTARDSFRRGLGRVSFEPVNPVPTGAENVLEVESAVARAFADARVPVGRIVTGILPLGADDGRHRDGTLRKTERSRRGVELTIAVEQSGRGWLVLRTPWSNDRGLVWRLLLQTLVLYVVVLLPVLWITRRISRPVRALTAAARGFGRGEGVAVPETGPGDVRALIAAFNALRLRIGGMLDEKDRMLGAIGHDLRTPLAALRVRIESVEDDTDRTKMADTIDEMSRTLDDILSLARLGRPSEPATEVDLSALLDAVVEDFRDLGADVGMADSPRIPVQIRPGLMRRAVRNLIENAVKYGGGAETSLTFSDREIFIAVADRGPGIPEERLNEAFDAFTRLEQSRNRDTGGSGLGLALARAIVRDAGGDVRLSNRKDGGLLAEIVLPRAIRSD